MHTRKRHTAITAASIGLLVGSSLLVATPAHAAPPVAGEIGYTDCWLSEANRTDVALIDPYDMRTWPVYVTPSEGEPGFTPHSGAASEGASVWTQVPRDDSRFLASQNGLPDGGATWDSYSASCYPTGDGVSYAGSAAILRSDGTVGTTATASGSYRNPAVWWAHDSSPDAFETVDLETQVEVQSTFDITFPVLQSVTDLNGDLTSDWYQGVNTFRVVPVINRDWVGFVQPDDLAAVCDAADAEYVLGDTATVTCITTGTIPSFSADEFAALADTTVPMTTILSIEARFVDSSGDLSGAWTSGALYAFAGNTIFEMDLDGSTEVPPVSDDPPTTPAGDELALTGSDSLPGLAWALLAVGAGLSLLVIARSRRFKRPTLDLAIDR